MVDILDPGEKRRELLDEVPRVGVSAHEVLEVIGDVGERHLLIAALVAESVNAVRRHVPVSSSVRLATSFPGARRGNRPFPAKRLGVRTNDTGFAAVSEGG